MEENIGSIIREDMIKAFVLGMQYAVKGMHDDDAFYDNVIEELFGNSETPATYDDIRRNVSNYTDNFDFNATKHSIRRLFSQMDKQKEKIEQIQKIVNQD